MDVSSTSERPVIPPAVDSRVYLLTDGPEALRVRLGLIDAAETELCMQYYLWHGDAAGALMASHTLAAADRGVRVAILLDDIDNHGRDDALLAMHGHPRIEVRVFNPFARGWLRPLEILTRFRELNRRMHNKALIADGIRCVVGGRNIGNAYFGLYQELAFNDLDLLGEGGIARDVRVCFQAYWGNPRSIEIAKVGHLTGLAGPGMMRTTLELAAAGGQEELGRLGTADPAGIDAWKNETSPATATLLADPPDKSWKRSKKKSTLAFKLDQALLKAQHEVLIVSPYFVPRSRVIRKLANLRERGVNLQVLTNSLASNDVVAVHAGYAPKRRVLLEMGIGLYELPPDSGQLRKSGKAKIQFRPSAGRSSLHAKVFVIDRTRCFIGSFNFDPRSARLNTEMGVMVDCPEVAAEAAEFALALMASSYKVSLAGGGGADSELLWTAADGQRFKRDPHAGRGIRLLVRLLGLLPIEGQL